MHLSHTYVQHEVLHHSRKTKAAVCSTEPVMIFVEVGLGFFVEYTLDEAAAFVTARIAALRKYA